MRILEVQCPYCSRTFNLYEPMEYTECFYCGRKLRITDGKAEEAGPGDDPEFEAVFTNLMRDGTSGALTELRDHYRDTLEGPGVDMVEGLLKMCDPAEMTDTQEAWDSAFESWENAFMSMEDGYYLPEYLRIVGMGVTSWSDVYGADPDQQNVLFKTIEDIVRARYTGDYYVIIYRHLLQGCMVYMEHDDPGEPATRMLEILSLEYVFDDPDYEVQKEKNRRIIEYADMHQDFPYTADLRPLHKTILDTIERRTAGLTDDDRLNIISEWDYIRIATELGKLVSDIKLASVLEQSFEEVEPNLLDRLLHKGARKYRFTVGGDVRKMYIPADVDMSPVEYSYSLLKSRGHKLGPDSMKVCVDRYYDALLNP